MTTTATSCKCKGSPHNYTKVHKPGRVTHSQTERQAILTPVRRIFMYVLLLVTDLQQNAAIFRHCNYNGTVTESTAVT